MTSRNLALLRHAKSSWSDPDLADHDRPLTSRGRRGATRMGRYLRDTGFAPDLVLCSSATRARETLELLKLPPRSSVLVEDQLYGASATELVARLRGVDDTARSVLLIGHNPGIQDAATRLASKPERLAEKFPTAGLAVLVIPNAPWTDLQPGIGDLRSFVAPRSLG